MLRKINLILTVGAAFFMGMSTLFGAVKVACVGDSITYGDGIKDRAKDSYPAKLTEILGANYEVKNFGVCGLTLMKETASPYWANPAYKASLDFAPDIVVIKLGTNDANPKHWRNQNEFERDLNALIDSYLALESRPQIYLCLPVPAFGGARAEQIALLAQYVRPIILKTALKRGLPVIDLYSELEGRHELFPDNLHPNEAGAKMIADKVGAVILKKN